MFFSGIGPYFNGLALLYFKYISVDNFHYYSLLDLDKYVCFYYFILVFTNALQNQSISVYNHFVFTPMKIIFIRQKK